MPLKTGREPTATVALRFGDFGVTPCFVAAKATEVLSAVRAMARTRRRRMA